MSVRAVKWTLWILTMCVAPLPYMLGGIEVAPPLRLLFFTGLIGGLQLTEGQGGFVWNTFLALGLVQLAAYGIGLYLLAALVARAWTALSPRRRLLVVSIIGIAALALAVGIPIYETPMSSESRYSTLLEVLR